MSLAQKIATQFSYDWLSPLAPTIYAELPAVQGCPVLTRLKAFVVDQGIVALLQHTFRDREGKPIDLSSFVPVFDESLSVSNSVSTSNSQSNSENSPGGSITVIVQEWTSQSYIPDAELPAVSPNPSAGQVVCPLPPAVVDHPGIYRLVWTIKDAAGRAVLINDSILSVERGLQATTNNVLSVNQGPPTLNELRNSIIDTGPGDNIRLDDIEFSTEQILLALSEPIRVYNEMLPRIPPRYTTKTFPHRGVWLRAAVGYLHLAAANSYRRNRHGVRAAGLADDSLNREQEYLREGMRLTQEFEIWAKKEKYVRSCRRAYGHIGSSYSLL